MKRSTSGQARDTWEDVWEEEEPNHNGRIEHSIQQGHQGPWEKQPIREPESVWEEIQNEYVLLYRI